MPRRVKSGGAGAVSSSEYRSGSPSGLIGETGVLGVMGLGVDALRSRAMAAVVVTVAGVTVAKLSLLFTGLESTGKLSGESSIKGSTEASIESSRPALADGGSFKGVEGGYPSSKGLLDRKGAGCESLGLSVSVPRRGRPSDGSFRGAAASCLFIEP
jgi:hypothetical protein